MTQIERMQELCAELSELRRCFGEWASLPGSQRSGPPALGLTEGPLREFFSRVSPDGVKAGSGHRPALDPRFSSDLDIVFDRDGSHFRLKVDASPVLAHLDVSSRTRWDPSKLYEDLTRLQRTIDDARALGTKTWTGLLAVGSGFRGHTAELMQLLHEFCHDRQLESWQWTAGDVWPFVDAVIVPGMLLKKHDLFESQNGLPDAGPYSTRSPSAITAVLAIYGHSSQPELSWQAICERHSGLSRGTHQRGKTPKTTRFSVAAHLRSHGEENGASWHCGTTLRLSFITGALRKDTTGRTTSFMMSPSVLSIGPISFSRARSST